MSGLVDIVAKTSEGIDAHTRSRVHAILATTRLRNPRPFYEHNFIIRPYNALHANWIHRQVVQHKEASYQNLHDVFYITDEPRKVLKELKDNKQLVEYSWDVFTITKYFIYHFKYVTRVIKRASMAELKSEEV